MKKIQVVALSAVIAIGACLTSCDGGGVSTNTSLKTENDTLSYIFGAYMVDQGLVGYLEQIKVYTDTAQVRGFYMRQIQADSTATQKNDSLRKEMKFKVDSIAKANDRNVAEFLKGFKEAASAPDSKSAYNAGYTLGGSFSQGNFPQVMAQYYGQDTKEKINVDAFLAAFSNSLKKKEALIPNATMEFNMRMQAKQMELQKKQEEEMKAQHADRIASEEKFLEENKSKEGVVTLPSGVQYKILKAGNGPIPKATDMVKVHYHGTLIDGTVFDSSVDRGNPSSFNVNGVIRGWTEVLQLMPVGSKWMVYIPENLAYGGQDRGTIPPFSALIFEVELLGIEKK